MSNAHCASRLQEYKLSFVCHDSPLHNLFCSYTYERYAIESWIARSSTSPMTGAPIAACQTSVVKLNLLILRWQPFAAYLIVACVMQYRVWSTAKPG